MKLRELCAGDEALLEEFLRAHANSSMFMRSNMRRAGIAYRGETYQATYAAAFRNGRVIGAAAHCWSGMVLLQAPEQTAEVVRACIAWSGRPVRGLAGPAEQVHRARVALGLENAPTAMEGDEELHALDLSETIVPHALSSGTVTCRPPHPGERDTLCAWRMAYDIELLGAIDSPESRHRAAAFLDAQIAEGNAWVALQDGVPVSLSAFNATLPEIVQLGGIYTPPELRGRGFAKVAVAGSLIAARDRGVSRAVLFTGNPSAVRTYKAVGFRHGSDYSLVLLK